MKEAVVKEKLIQLCDVMMMIPEKDGSKTPIEGIYSSTRPAKGQTLDEVVDQLQLQLKYLVFDLEATRRENNYLRRMIENRNRPKSDDSSEGKSDF